jgi:hypothetical protein
MKIIELTQNKVSLVDDEDYDFLMHWKWRVNKGYNTFYAFNKKAGLMHRLILDLNDVIIKTDHIDGNGLNNQKYNIRACTNAQNMSNREEPVSNKSGYKGVVFKGNKYQAQIQLDGKNIYLGLFKTAIEAAMAYDEAAKELHGDFSNLNFK